jgi:hypothetical protein
VGFRVSGGTLNLGVFTSREKQVSGSYAALGAADIRKYTGLTGSLGSARLQGVDAVKMIGSGLTLSLNRVSSGTAVMDWKQGKPLVTDASNPLAAAGVALSATDPNVGDVLTFSASGQSQAYVLDQSLGLGFSGGNEYLNYGGLNEKWFTTSGGTWYYITPEGNLYRWLGGSSLAGDPLVATLDSSYWSNTALIYNAQANNPPATFSISGSNLIIDPNSGFVGVFYVTVVVNDGREGTDSKQFKVTVT